eukprot:jgi/Galph1/5213/GphlegSOOS_G3875.1
MLQLLSLFLYLYDTYWKPCFFAEDQADRRKTRKLQKQTKGRRWKQTLKEKVKSLRRRQSRKLSSDKMSVSEPSEILDLPIDEPIGIYTVEEDDIVLPEEKLARLSFSSQLATLKRRKALSEEELDSLLQQLAAYEWDMHKWFLVEE